MATVSILANPLANAPSSTFSEPPQIISNSSNPSSDQPQPSTSQSDGNQPVTEVIIEALRSKDRLFVLKLGEQMETLINERKNRIDVNPTTSYQRLLVHRCSAYYRLAPENDPTSKGIIVYPTVDSKIPSRRIAELVPPEETAQPAFKIMRRIQQDRPKLKPASQSGSIAGEDADLSDLDPSETGSQGGRSNPTGSSKKYMTIEEREAAYNEARSRIFMDFEEKEKAKEKDMSASASTLSQLSGSASTSAGRDSGSVGDMEDSLSSVATESEWSGPVARNEKPRRSGSGNTSAGSSRSLRPFNNGGSSRNSRATSPSFSYASLYEPPPASYDQPQYIGHPQMGYSQPYMYPSYPPPTGQPMGQGVMPQYPYYQPYPYHSQHSHSDPTSPSMSEPVFHPQPHPHSQSQQLSYPPQYIWPPGHHHPPPQPPQHPQSAPPQPVRPPGTPNMPPPQAPGYLPQFMPPSGQYGHYPVPYYQSHPQGPPSTHPPHPPPPMHGQLYHPDNNNGQGAGRVIASPNQSADSQNGRRVGGSNNGRRNAPKVRPTWSYGPGPGGIQYNNNNGDSVGPRFTSSRRTSGTSSAGSRTPGDEASSTTSSSTTSSSSRHTYTSTSTTSKHPLPARPDWAVGLKAQPTLSPRGHHDQHQDSRNSPSRNGPRQNVQHLPPVFLQSADFPPLSNMSSNPERRTPAVSGAWNNPTFVKSVMTPSSGLGTHGSALVRYPNGGGPQEGKRLYQESGGGEPNIDESILTGRMGSMTLDGTGEKTEGPAPTEELVGR